MKVRKRVAVFVASVLLTACLFIYLMLDISLFPQALETRASMNDNQWVHFENRLLKLEKDIDRQQRIMNVLHKNAREKTSGLDDTLGIKRKSFPYSSLTTCTFDARQVPQVDVQMLDIYKQLEFDNPNGGVWKQGWNIKYNEKQWHPNRKLIVFVVPHSHNDPGWLNTFERYYTFQTQNILNNMVTKLAEDRRRKFIWAEVSFFELWWEDQSKPTRDLVKRLVHDGQLEIVAGGYVMPDESVSHWMAQLTQLTEGHQWLKTNLDYVPNTGWAIDPFGLSPTMPYLLKNAGLENLAIQRIHYSVKKKLAKDKNLEFRWRQLWDNDGTTELFTHAMPFYSYDIPHTCGPDPKVCCQFDFYRLPNFGLTCPWKIAPKAITPANIVERATTLLDQYRRKAQLYRSNVVLIPLGDDFRYSHVTEWDAQYSNYQKLFDYMNNNPQMNVQIQFGTLSDYFDAVHSSKNLAEFPSLSGDFFTYADRDDHYWSGYYTSRPFHKRLDRVLLHLLRASELLNTIAWTKGNSHLVEGSLYRRLSMSRKWHSLFQHHDGVTGTARDNVVVDYAQKMITALNNSAHILQQATVHLLRTPQGTAIDTESLYLSLDEHRAHHTSAGEKYVISLGDDYPLRKIILFNSLSRQRTRVMSLYVSTPFVRVTDRMGQPVQCQISPVWVGPAALSAARYELSFLVTVPALGITTYIIHSLHGMSLPPEVHLANVTVYNTVLPISSVPGFSNIQTVPSTQEFSISQRPELSAAFGKSGLLKALRISDTTFPVHLEFVKYGTRGAGQDKSGAYLFLPDKPEPDPLHVANDRIVHLVIGPILSRVFVDLPHVKHICTLFNSTGGDGLGLHIINQVDITETQNLELAMRIDTDIKSNDQFFTDLNGLNMIRRQRFSKIPLQGNYYPLAAAGYIEDSRVRMTIATAQPLGATSMASGQFEIMQDRKLVQDDNRGLGQGVTDNLPTSHLFFLVLEKKRESCSYATHPADHPAGQLSVAGQVALDEILHPVIALHPLSTLDFELSASYSPVIGEGLPVDLSLASLRVIPIPEGAGKGVGVVLHRQALDRCWGDEATSRRFPVSNSGEVDLGELFSHVRDWTVSEAPLTFTSVGATRKPQTVGLCPQQVSSFLLHRTEF